MLDLLPVSPVEEKANFRRKVEQIRKAAIGGVSVVKEGISGAYTPNIDDSGQLHQFNDASDQSWTLPTTFPQGWWIEIEQIAAGRPTFTGANALGGVARISGQWGKVTLEVISNDNGSSATWMVSGDVG